MPFSLWTRINRLKRLDASNLYHTEWNRELGSVAIFALLGSLGFPTGVFLLVPYCAKYVAGPSTALAVLMAFVVAVLTGLHLIEILGRIPKSGCSYIFTYMTFGEIWAFLCGWTTVFDYCATAAYLAKGWSAHFDHVFHGNVRRYLNPTLGQLQPLDFNETSSFVSAPIFDQQFDLLAVIGLLIAAMVVLFGVGVVSVVCMTLLLVGALVVSSSILVGFFYANAINWSHSGYFIASFPGICKAASCLLRSMVGLELVGSLVEETTNAQHKLAVLMPLSNGLLFVYLFLMSAIITLVVPFSELPEDAALPAVYGYISVQASRYVLSVGSICCFSGALLVAVLPGVRQLHALSSDGLLPPILARFWRPAGAPATSLAASLALMCALVTFSSPTLLAGLRLALPARFLLITCCSALQRYRDTPSGLLAEVARYKSVQLAKSVSSFVSNAASSLLDGVNGGGGGGGGGGGAGRPPEAVGDDFSLGSSLFIRNIAAAQLTDEPQDDEVTLFSRTAGLEKNRLLTPEANNHRSVSLQSVSLCESDLSDGFVQRRPHNCLRSPCTPNADCEPYEHLYQRDIPESLPYCETFSMHGSSETVVDQMLVFRKAKLWLAFCVCALLAFAACLVRGWSPLQDGLWPAFLLTIAAFLAVVVAAVGVSCLPKNVDSRVRHQAPAVPYLSLVNCFLLSLMLASADLLGICQLAIVLSSGAFVYFLYGFRHSTENRLSVYITPLAATELDENTGLVGAPFIYRTDEGSQRMTIDCNT